jgi:hypothetical protein
MNRARVKAVERMIRDEKAVSARSVFLRPSFSAAVAAIAAVIFIGVTFYIGNFQEELGSVEEGAMFQEFSEVDVLTVPTKEGVMLTWEDNESCEYLVMRSNSPRNFDNSDSVIVCGNRLVERRENTGGLEFYKVFRTGKGCS